MKLFRDHLLVFILMPAIVVIAIVSYNKFMVNHDYVVSYEGGCDPAVQQCFIGCEDDECAETYYYSQVQKYAQDLYAQCGEDITDCEAANECLLDDRECSVTFCSPEINGDNSCSSPSELEDNEINNNI